MPDPITPALTAEEWKRVDACIAEGFAPSQLVEVFGDSDDPRRAPAVLLHGQPFGFTWEDVDEMRSAADFVAGVYDSQGGREENEAQALKLRSLADRIAALLPPRQG